MTARRVSATKWLMWWSWMMGISAGAGLGLIFFVHEWFWTLLCAAFIFISVTFFWTVWYSITEGECGDIVKGVGNASYCCRKEFGHRGYHAEGTVEWTGVS